MLKITRAVVDAVKIPVTVKTRLGWDHDSKIIVDLAERLQDCGIAALTIHGRTRSQMYTGEADWTLIGEVKNNPRMRIPIIGNGDVVVLKKPEGRLKYLDVALYRRSNGDFVLHRVVGFDKDSKYIFCGDNQFHKERGITDENIIGVVTAFYRKGKHYTDNSLSYRFYKSAWEYIKAPMRMLYSAHRMNKSINIKKKR